jgi:SAM-dependent methyltransferase
MSLLSLLKKAIPVRVRRAARILLRGEPSRAGAPENPFQAAGREIEKRGLFVGCPLEYFETTSKDLFCLALLEGLNPSASVLEVGCGCLRTGYQFIRYLMPGCYFGIEPNIAMLDAGRELLLGTLGPQKLPHFNHNDTFSFSVFGTTFDFVVACSIWSHASKGQIARMLDEFRCYANPGGKFITSWIPSRPDTPDHEAKGWIGRSHRCDTPGMVAHSREWLTEAATTRGLAIREFDGFTTLNQTWLIITRS